MSEELQVIDEKFHEERKTGIGGSEAAGVMGLSRYSSPMSVWNLKTGRTEPFGGNEYTEWGTILEPIIRMKFAKEKELEVIYDPEMKRSEKHPFMIAHLDGIIYDEKTDSYGVLECKNVSEWKKHEWEDNDVPVEYMIQMQHNLEVMGYDWGYFAALIGGNHLEITKVKRDDEFIKKIVEAERYFWNEYVLKDKEPPFDGSESSEEVLKHLYPEAKEKQVKELPPYVEDLIGELLPLKAQYEEIEKKIKAIEQQIKDEMGEYETGITENCRVRWSNVNKFNKEKFLNDHPDFLKKHPDFAKVDLNSSLVRKEYPELYEEYKEPSHRKFTISDL
jgi:putative phage-type endonuclease